MPPLLAAVVTKTPALRLSANLAKLVGSAMEFVNTPRRGPASWKHILVDPSQTDSILAEADSLHAAGGLFSKLEPDEGETMQFKEQDDDDEMADGLPPEEADKELEAEAAAAATGTAADPETAVPEPALPDPVVVVPEAPDPVVVVPEAVPSSSTEQLSKWVALAVYGNPSKRQLEAWVGAATSSGAASSSTGRWTNKLFQSRGRAPLPQPSALHPCFSAFSGYNMSFFLFAQVLVAEM